MRNFEVTYSLGTRTGGGAFIGESNMQYQKIVVRAVSSNMAQRIVENMFGGTDRCQANPGVPV